MKIAGWDWDKLLLFFPCDNLNDIVSTSFFFHFTINVRNLLILVKVVFSFFIFVIVEYSSIHISHGLHYQFLTDDFRVVSIICSFNNTAINILVHMSSFSRANISKIDSCMWNCWVRALGAFKFLICNCKICTVTRKYGRFPKPLPTHCPSKCFIFC